MLLDRDRVLSLLISHAEALRVHIVKAHHQYVLTLEVAGVSYRACLLSRSSDYYEKRMNLQPRPVSLLICAEHDSCVPLSVLALDEGYQYAPREVPHWYTPEKRFTTRGSRVFLGQLLCGMQAAFDELDDRHKMSRATKYRYLARLRAYLKRKQGRQIAV
jgi:hypothetical protein